MKKLRGNYLAGLLTVFFWLAYAGGCATKVIDNTGGDGTVSPGDAADGGGEPDVLESVDAGHDEGPPDSTPDTVTPADVAEAVEPPDVIDVEDDVGPECASDNDCFVETRPYCLLPKGECVTCIEDAHCADEDPCNADTCVNNACVYQSLGCCESDQECGDGNGCTLDTCTEDGACVHTLVPDCCIDDMDCADESACTADSCVFYECVHEVIPNCCTEDEDCGDSGECTEVACVNGTCQTTPLPDCCANNTHCDDGDPCTEDDCVAATCVNTPTGECCILDSQCDDGLPCTLDLCENNACTHESWPGCCAFDSECDDGDPCTANKCIVGTGEYQFLESGCCANDAECQDDDPCIVDVCSGGACEFLAGDECVTLNAAADCWLEGSNNHGGDGFIIVGKTGEFQKKRTLIRFDTSSVPQGTQILGATLNVYFQWQSKPGWLPNEQGIDRVIQVHRVLKHWEENQATSEKAANNAPWSVAYVGLNGDDADIEPLDSELWPTGVYEWKKFDVTSAAKAWIAQPADNHGLLLWATNEDESGMDMRMPSREYNDDASLRPKLNLIYD